MGYAKTLIYSLDRAFSGGISAGTMMVSLATTNTNYSLGTLTTPAYTDALKSAYIEFVCQARADSSGALNYHSNAFNGYLGLNDGSGTFSCGAIPQGAWWTLANDFQGVWTVYGRTNIAANLAPSTNYTCQLMHCAANGDNLNLYAPCFLLTMIFEG